MDTQQYWNDSHIKLNQNPPSEWVIKVEKLFPRNSKVLDLGGGQGRDAIYMNEHGHEVIIIDISENAKSHFELNKLPLEYVLHDLSKLPYPFPDNSFHVIYSRLSLHYFSPSEIINIFKELCRILIPGGKAFISVKSPNDTEEMGELRKKSEEVEPGLFKAKDMYHSRYSHDQIACQLESAGITNYKVNESSETLRSPSHFGNDSLVITEIFFEK